MEQMLSQHRLSTCRVKWSITLENGDHINEPEFAYMRASNLHKLHPRHIAKSSKSENRPAEHGAPRTAKFLSASYFILKYESRATLIFQEFTVSITHWERL